MDHGVHDHFRTQNLKDDRKRKSLQAGSSNGSVKEQRFKNGKAYSRTASSFKNATKENGDKINVLGHVNPYTAGTVKLLAAVITNYAGRGFQFVTVPELETGVANSIDWVKAAAAVSAPARAGGVRVPTSVPTPIDPLNMTYTFAQANGITCR